MRRFCLWVAFFALLAAIGFLWAFRFQRDPGLPVWRLADLRAATPGIPGLDWTGPAEQPSLRIRSGPSDQRVAARITIPGMPLVEMLHLRFRMKARGLTPGSEVWEDGRFMVEWHAPDGASEPATDPVGSIRFDDQVGLEDFVIVHPHGPALPVIRVEHLGREGEFEIQDLEISVVKERWIWKTGRWFLLAGWLAWAAACVRSWPEISWSRAILASAVWVLMGTHFVFPGPWKLQRPLVMAFQLSQDAGKANSPDPSVADIAAGGKPPALVSGRLPALGKMPTQGDLALRIKLSIKRARPLLHVLMLFCPTLAIAWLAGRKPALFLMITLSLAIELAQVGFGYGFDRIDVLDLTTDAAGIALAMWVWRKFGHRFPAAKVWSPAAH